MEGATNQLDQEVLDDDLVLPIENGKLTLLRAWQDNILAQYPYQGLDGRRRGGLGLCLK